MRLRYKTKKQGENKYYGLEDNNNIIRGGRKYEEKK